MTAPFGIEEGLRWFLSHSPGGSGMCARHSWRSLGGINGNPPAWGAADANALYDKIIASRRYWTTEPPRGALVVWKYGRHGHAARGYGDGRIATTDPQGHSGGTGIESLSYPHKWGASASHRIWTDTYNGVRFLHVEAPASSPSGARVRLDNLRYGKTNDDVKDLQRALNRHLSGDDLPVTGYYGDMTDAAVRRCQQAHDLGEDAPRHSFVGSRQARHLGLVVA
jgi:hypothetical protein